MKICVVNIQVEEIAQLFTYYAQEVGRKVLRADTKVDVKSPKPGITRGFDQPFAYFRFLNTREIIEKIIEAEKEGYDAAVVHCFLDPGIREAREIVNIPVIGPGESTLLFAHMLGYKFGIVTPAVRKMIPLVEDMLKRYGLETRAILNPVRPMSMPFEEFLLKGEIKVREEVVADLLQKGRECVADGAEVVVIGCTALGPLCTLSEVAKIPELDVPMLDCLAVALKVAETVADFNQKLGLPPVSRVNLYAMPREKDFKRVRETFGLRPIAGS